jgi:hypothetical protein
VNLADAIAAAHAQNESALAAQIAPYELDNEARQFAGTFVRWCNDHGVRSCPATPATVAAFVRSMGASQKEIAEALAAIVELHDSRGLSNPVATAAVRSELSRILKLRPPRSWRIAEQLMFAELPPEIGAAVERREQQRDIELRKMQNELAELKQKGLQQ